MTDEPTSGVEAVLREALKRLDRLFTYPVAAEINPRGYGIRADNADGVEFAVEIIRAALATPPASPATEGWKLVPIEPTANMMREGWRVLREKNDFQTRLGNSLVGTETPIYEAMIAAAPEPPPASPSPAPAAVGDLVARLNEIAQRGCGYNCSDEGSLSDCAEAATALSTLAADKARAEVERDDWEGNADHWQARALAAETERDNLRKVARWNIEEDGALVRVCHDLHEKGEKCEFVRYVPETALAGGLEMREDRNPAWNAIYQTLRNYRLSNMRDDIGGDYQLIDLMSNDGCSIATGEEEMTLLADEISRALAAETVLAAREVATDAVPVGWRDISTAPKDKHVLLCGRQIPDDSGVRFSGEIVTSGYWDGIDTSWCMTGSTWQGPFIEPTHWMPLPASPTPPAPAPEASDER